MKKQKSVANLLGLSALCTSVTYSGIASAQGNEAETLAEVIVTAQRREEQLKDVPLTVTALSGSQLTNAGVTNIFDLQNVVSGLTYSGVGNSTQPAIRGLNTLVSTNGSENPNALYVDGVYYATNQLFGANLPDVARVEVLKGPQGTLFGRNSTGGAIRVFTKDPTNANTGDFTLDGGYYTGSGTSRSNPHIAARGFVSIPIIDDTLAASLSGGYDTTDGFLTNDATGEKYGDIERINARAKVLFTPTDWLRAVVSAFYLEHDDTGLQSQTPLNGLVAANFPTYPTSVVPTLPYHTSFDSGLGVDFNVADVQSNGLSASIEFQLGDIGTLTSVTATNDNKINNLTTFTHSKDAINCLTSFACVAYDYKFTLKAFSQELNFASKQFGMFRTTAGLFYYHQKSTTTARLQGTTTPGGIFSKREEFKIDSYAAYGELEFQPIDALTLTGGGRYTREPHDDTSTGVAPKSVTFSSFVPRFTARYAMTPQLNGYVSYSKGEKSGLSGIANTASTPPFQPVEPEENTAYEIGMKYGSSVLLANVAVFHYDYKNKQEQGFTGTNVFLLNSGPVTIKGVDVDLSARLSREFTLRTAISWLPVAEYDDFKNATGFGLARNPGVSGTFARLYFDASGRRLAKAPELTGNLALEFTRSIGPGAVDAGVNASYSMRVYHDLNRVIKQSPYSVLNAQAGYEFGESGLHLSLYGRNLTNKNYISSGFSSGVGYTVAYARPREIGLSLNYSY